ncbi:hypothetical protein JO84_gp053 [Aureococcus anophagefferens virus]|uniref:BspA family leucine-rich repeat surface protein n=1 Tax=Aureococcus anophagefferens virus TaxID=1474867 RepID=A0A076FFZ2_9VIRU|nr:hypothetical protein JO84_gp053 [Aureococcus anophagefferens virus]AII16935.1 hypothetical protein AaV_053 [Aureococcus anophagefferens virus]UOG94354.1 hypothetical protein MKD35_319 [Aureococcus anophagefferens virus]
MNVHGLNDNVGDEYKTSIKKENTICPLSNEVMIMPAYCPYEIICYDFTSIIDYLYNNNWYSPIRNFKIVTSPCIVPEMLDIYDENKSLFNIRKEKAKIYKFNNNTLKSMLYLLNNNRLTEYIIRYYGIPNNWNVSNVTDMSYIFSDQQYTIFNYDINNWDVSNVTNMESMFKNNIYFNKPINNWNVLKVTNMTNMFNGATQFDQSISNWNLNNKIITDMFSNKEQEIKCKTKSYPKIDKNREVNIMAALAAYERMRMNN